MILEQINTWVVEAFNRAKGALYFISFIILQLLLWIKDDKVSDYFNNLLNSIFHLNADFDYFGFNMIYSICNIFILHLLYNLFKLKWSIVFIILLNIVLIGIQINYYIHIK